MSKTDFIRYVVKGVTYISTAATEQQIKKDLFEIFRLEPDVLVEVRDYNTGYLYEELPLNDIFNEPDK